MIATITFPGLERSSRTNTLLHRGVSFLKEPGIYALPDFIKRLENAGIVDNLSSFFFEGV